MKIIRGKPAYLVTATLHSAYLKKPITYTIQVYGFYPNPWVAQAIAARKWFHILSRGTEQEKSRYNVTAGKRIVFDHPRPLAIKIDREKWGL